jgi:hypothetical protein
MIKSLTQYILFSLNSNINCKNNLNNYKSKETTLTLNFCYTYSWEVRFYSRHFFYNSQKIKNNFHLTIITSNYLFSNQFSPKYNYSSHHMHWYNLSPFHIKREIQHFNIIIHIHLPICKSHNINFMFSTLQPIIIIYLINLGFKRRNFHISTMSIQCSNT